MRTKILILLTFAAFFYACKKSSYTTRPQISFNNVNSTVLYQGNIVTFQLNFTDKEGDIQDTLWVEKVSRTCPSTPGVQFISKNKVPDFTANSNLDGKLEISFVYNANVPGLSSIIGCSNKNDTSYFRFWLKDKAQNRSDTIASPDIILVK
ncbi:MAG TPA: hypothetical protein VJ552_12610 [Sediminibacterium sp.]|nr:hypothetical protein [Sediminibacterium sp.]